MTITLFSADDGVGGVELWATDGTDAGTHLVKDINPGADGSNPANTDFFGDPMPLVALGGDVYFLADDGSGEQIWRSDGTTAGTQQVTELPQIFGFGGPAINAANLISENNVLFFASDDFTGQTIFAIDGTPGAAPVQLGPTGVVTSFVGSQDAVYWSDSADGGGLFRSDGVHATQQLTTAEGALFQVGSALYYESSEGLQRVDGTTLTQVQGWFEGDPRAHVGNTLYLANFGFDGGPLFAITDDGTRETLLSNTILSLDLSMAAAGDLLVFAAASRTQIEPNQIWVSDGTAAGTKMLAQGFANVDNVTTVGGIVFFTDNADLWKSDGTAAGTVLVKSIEPAFDPDGENNIQATAITNLTVVGNELYFSANDGVNGTEPWMSDGTTAGTHMISSVNDTVTNGQNPGDPGTQHVLASTIATMGGLTYYMGSQIADGNELWVTDGTAAGTHIVKDIYPGFSNANPDDLTVASSQMFFVANDGTHGGELWVTDGTGAGTHMVRDIAPGTADGVPDPLITDGQIPFIAIGDRVIFQANDGTDGPQSWISDGTAAGTMALSTAFPGYADIGSGDRISGDFAVAGSNLFLAQAHSGGGEDLYVSNGTPGSEQLLGTFATLMLEPIRSINPADGNTLYFAAGDGAGHAQIWKTDGTAAGTVQFSVTGDAPTFPVNMGVTDGKLYFVTQGELWMSSGMTIAPVGSLFLNDESQIAGTGNGAVFFTSGDKLYATSGGTPVLIDPTANEPISPPPGATHVVSAPNGVFFQADDGVHGAELWFSDGTVAGTHLVKDINPGSGSSDAGGFQFGGTEAAYTNGKLFFAAYDPVHGQELWTSDGTEAGTQRVTELAPGANQGGFGADALFGMHVSGNDVVFGFNNQFWISDGTAAGTVQITDAQYADGSNPSAFTTLAGNFTGTTNADILGGAGGDDVITGLAGDDMLSGLADNDVMTGGAGNDRIDGGEGSDIAAFSGALANYTIAHDATSNAFTVTDMRDGSPDGTDTVTNVEKLQFSDSHVLLDTTGTAAWLTQTVRLDGAQSIASVTTKTQGGDIWLDQYDTTNGGTVLWTSAHETATGQTISITGTNDDGTHFLMVYDLADAYGWANATVHYDANWNQTGVNGESDTGSGLTSAMVASVESTLDTLSWFATPYDPNTGTQLGVGAPTPSLSLTGGGNADVLFGFSGNDMLSGGGGNDILQAGTGNDTLTGGAGNDRFVFHDGDGLDTITDFAAGDSGGDVIALHAYGITSFAQLQPLISQVGSDTLIAFDPDNHILLHNVTATQLNANDFVFH